ncbi:MAG TPA: hypothetical protein VIE88_11065 [Vicinamibacteria bacterium]|jgi:hypothetical protein
MGRHERGSRVRTWAVLGFLAASTGCALEHVALRHSAPTSPGVDPDGEWQKAQGDLIQLEPSVDGDPYEVAMRTFRIETERAPFYCGETGLHAVLLVYGCFRAEPEAERLGVIRYVPGKGALRHEARHAILYALGDPRWADVGH